MLPAELILLILRTCDLRTKTQFLLVSKIWHQETKRLLRPKVVVIRNKRKEIVGKEGDVQIVTTYEDRGTHHFKSKIKYFDKYSNKHRESMPASISWFPNGNKRLEVWYKDGKIHREEFPAITKWYMNGFREHELWYTEGKRNREQSGKESVPAETMWFPNGFIRYEGWYKNNKLHREDGPAEIEWGKNGENITAKRWYKDGKRHRKNDPAVILFKANGEICFEVWYENGVEGRYRG